MADWKQITARIRRARTAKDPAGQLANLFAKTRDAMVAFELARYFESKGNNEDAGRWYLTAAQRFRRADWKTKAQESATRLGATEPAEIPASTAAASDARTSSVEEPETAATDSPVEEKVAEAEVEAKDAAPEPPEATARPHDRQRRGRRGVREQRPSRRGTPSHPPRERQREQAPPRSTREEVVAEPPPLARRAEAAGEASLPTGIRGRFGDPGLSSRLTQLEMNFRRLLACAPCALDDAEKAPAGPGVWVLTDSDLSTYYYVEPCQTLRVAIPHLLRSNASRHGGESIKPRLAEHLGIPETRVAKYLADHCVVRWLQLDDDAAYFAHFLIAVLRPALNE
jgi:hypothetical protein